ncbi:MAG: hypothetical protein ACLFOY_11725 [Desulfatibacillaceae bacterium]
MKTSNWTDIREIRKFGAVALVFFGLLLAVGLWRERLLAVYLFGALSALGFLHLVLPGPMKPVYRGWLAVARAIGTVVTTVLLALVYFVVITPSGWIRRLVAGPILPMQPDREAETYWVEREERVQPRERFTKRF